MSTKPATEHDFQLISNARNMWDGIMIQVHECRNCGCQYSESKGDRPENSSRCNMLSKYPDCGSYIASLVMET